MLKLLKVALTNNDNQKPSLYFRIYWFALKSSFNKVKTKKNTKAKSSLLT